MRYSRDARKLPRITIGCQREQNRFLVMVAHNPIFNKLGSPRITYPGKSALGQHWIESHGPWIVVLHRDMTMGEEPHYAILRLIPTTHHWGQKPLEGLYEAARREARLIVRDWNESGIKPPADRIMSASEWSGRKRP